MNALDAQHLVKSVLDRYCLKVRMQSEKLEINKR